MLLLLLLLLLIGKLYNLNFRIKSRLGSLIFFFHFYNEKMRVRKR